VGVEEDWGSLRGWDAGRGTTRHHVPLPREQVGRKRRLLFEPFATCSSVSRPGHLRLDMSGMGRRRRRLHTHTRGSLRGTSGHFLARVRCSSRAGFRSLWKHGTCHPTPAIAPPPSICPPNCDPVAFANLPTSALATRTAGHFSRHGRARYRQWVRYFLGSHGYTLRAYLVLLCAPRRCSRSRRCYR
jgi:hypothetical protein